MANPDQIRLSEQPRLAVLRSDVFVCDTELPHACVGHAKHSPGLQCGEEMLCSCHIHALNLHLCNRKCKNMPGEQAAQAAAETHLVNGFRRQDAVGKTALLRLAGH